MTARTKLNTKPYRNRHHTVMNYMECTNMIILFSQHKEELETKKKINSVLITSKLTSKAYCIEKFGEFWYIVPPTSGCHSHCCRILRVINWLTSKTVSIKPPRYACLKEKQFKLLQNSYLWCIKELFRMLKWVSYLIEEPRTINYLK